MTSHPDFPGIQRRLKALGFYDAAIDDDWGPGMSAGIDQALSVLEHERGIQPPAVPVPPAPAPAAGGAEFAHLPAAYGWLKTLSYLPKHLRAAMTHLGTLEAPGAVNNAVIMEWAKRCREAGIDVAGYTADSVPWCGLFQAVCMLGAGRVDEAKAIGGALWALNWSKFGVDGGQPELGDILTFKREGGGHVAQYIAEDATAYHVIGGNQSDRVSIMRIAKNRLYGCRQPNYKEKAPAIKPYIMDATGKLSTNEA